MSVIDAGVQLFDMCAKPTSIRPTKANVAELVQTNSIGLVAVSA